jgi:hypothetical protein
MKNFIIQTHCKMSRIRSRVISFEKMRFAKKNLVKLDHLKNLDIDDVITLKYMLKK